MRIYHFIYRGGVEMKRTIAFLVLGLVVIAAAFSSGIQEEVIAKMTSSSEGWYWAKEPDPMTDDMVYTFMKAPSSEDNSAPWFVLRYNAGTNEWKVGIADSMLMGDDFTIMLRIGHNPPQTVSASKIDNNFVLCSADSGLPFADAEKVALKYVWSLGTLDSEKVHLYSMAGLKESFTEAGIK
jgi:hypothetical protein